MVMSPAAQFTVARQIRSAEGAAIGDVFSFVSGLYFRGKLAYARRFACPPDPTDPVAAGGVLVITPNAGLRSAQTAIGVEQFTAFARATVDIRNPAYRLPLEQGARALLQAVGPDCEIVLLGSIASGKYVEILQPIFGDCLVFPPAFVGRGDMSRGGLLLRCVMAGVELEYVPIAGAIRHGQRPPRLEPIKGILGQGGQGWARPNYPEPAWKPLSQEGRDTTGAARGRGRAKLPTEQSVRKPQSEEGREHVAASAAGSNDGQQRPTRRPRAVSGSAAKTRKPRRSPT